jgi:hypothetical protein
MVINLKLSGHFDLKAIRNFALVPQTWLVNALIDQRTNGYCIFNDIQMETDAEQQGGVIMDDKDKKKKGDQSAAKACCYHVVDGCGCIVGTYCCDGPDMSKCRFESCC